MGHHIHAIVCPLPIDIEQAKRLDLPVLKNAGFAIIPLHYSHSDYWENKQGKAHESYSDMMHDSATTQEFARRLGITKFALVETDYFGGVGEQFATVYENGVRRFNVTEGGINKALGLIGVEKAHGKDEFETVGLGKYREFSSFFEKYMD